MADQLPSRISIEEMQTLAKLFFDSGMFKKDVGSIAQAFVKIKAGEEFGMTPFVAMQSLNIIQGKVEMNGDAQARMLKQSGKYDYRVTQHTDQLCEITFHAVSGPAGVELGKSTFTMQDAERAGLLSNPTWKKFPKNMLFYRALTNGVAFHCPDATAFRTYGEGEISGDPPAPRETFATPADNALGVDLDEMVDKITGEVRPKVIEAPKPSFTDKLKAREKVSTQPPALQMAQALKVRQEGWDEDGHAKHPMDDEEEPADKVALDAEAKMFASELSIAKQWIRQIKDEQGGERCLQLILECFGRTVTKLGDVETALKELSLGQLVDGIEALKQKRSEKR